jgi:MoaA/NifB/PqqE/SkfB family radical SAM enzyme
MTILYGVATVNDKPERLPYPKNVIDNNKLLNILFNADEDNTIKKSMQKSPLTLEEVLWEITSNCNKNCSFCGSKDIINQGQLSDEDLCIIAYRIGQTGVKEVTLSGGEPGTLSESLLKKIIKTLKDYKCQVKAVTNGTLIQKYPKIAKSFDRIGLSINSKSELGFYSELLSLYSKCEGKNITVVTNFGQHNIWELQDIKDFIGQRKLLWQIQLTTGPNALPEEGIKMLWEKIKPSKTIVFADNLQYEHVCSAGWRSCGVLYNGDVVACLSERSYCKKMTTYGNVTQKSLIDIWETEFRDIRFGTGKKTCRDCFKYPDCDKLIPTTIFDKFSSTKIIDEDQYKEDLNTYMYGVSNPNGLKPNKWPKDKSPKIIMYGVFGGETMMYSVTGDRFGTAI